MYPYKNGFFCKRKGKNWTFTFLNKTFKGKVAFYIIMVLYILVWIVFCMLHSLLGSFSDVMDRLVARVFFSIFLLKESKTCLIHMFHKQKKLLVNNFRPGNRLVPLYALSNAPFSSGFV